MPPSHLLRPFVVESEFRKDCVLFGNPVQVSTIHDQHFFWHWFSIIILWKETEKRHHHFETMVRLILSKLVLFSQLVSATAFVGWNHPRTIRQNNAFRLEVETRFSIEQICKCYCLCILYLYYISFCSSCILRPRTKSRTRSSQY